MLLVSIVLLLSAVALYVGSAEILLYSRHPWPVYGLLLAAIAAAAAAARSQRAWRLGVMALAALVAVAVVYVHSFRSSAERPELAVSPGDPFPEFSLATSTGGRFSPSELRGKSAALYVFYRGDWCPFCRKELQSLVQYYGRFRESGVELFAVSVDPPETSAALRQRLGLPFTFLSDPDGEVLDRLAIRHRSAHDGRDIAYPAQVLVDRDGIVRWTFSSDSIRRRARPADALAAISRTE